MQGEDVKIALFLNFWKEDNDRDEILYWYIEILLN